MATKLFLRSKGATFVRTDHVKSSFGVSYEVVIFSEKDNTTIGQYVFLVGTIIINQVVLQKSKLLDFVLVHEFAHAKQWYGIILGILCCVALLVAVYALTLTIAMLVAAIIRFNINVLGGFGIFRLLTLGALFIASMFSWILEYNADSKAISVLGNRRVSEALDEKKQLATSKSKALKVIVFLTHPPIKLTLGIYKILHGGIPS